MEIIAQGIWCNDCEFFEEVENLENGRCTGCGCPEDKHRHVHLVPA